MSEAADALVPQPEPSVEISTLRPEVADMLRRGGIGGRFRVGELLSLLEEAESMDKKAGARASSARLTGILLFVGSFLTIPLSPLFGSWMIVVFPGMLVVALFAMFWSWRYSRYDVPDDFRLSFLPVLDAIRNDIPRKSRVQLTMDLSGPLSRGKQVQKIDSGWQGTYLFSTECRTHYLDPWCLFEAPLADGSRLRLEFWNEVLERLRIRGRKSKRKYKYKKVACVRVTVLPPGGKFDWTQGALQEAGAGGAKLKSKRKAGEAVYSLVSKAKHAQRGSCPEGGVPPGTTLNLLMKLYSALSPRARAGGAVSHV